MENKDELSFEELENVSGGAGSDSERFEMEGTVLAPSGAGIFQVEVGGKTIDATLSGKMRMNFVVPRPGDRVLVEIHPDSRYGRITYRYK